jgi:hypothetical protein
MRVTPKVSIAAFAALLAGCAGGAQGPSVASGAGALPPAGFAQQPSDWAVNVHYNAHGKTTRQAFVLATASCFSIKGAGVWINPGQQAALTGVPSCAISDPKVARIEVSIAPEWLRFSCFLKVTQRPDGHTQFHILYKHVAGEVDRCRFYQRSGSADLFYSL